MKASRYVVFGVAAIAALLLAFLVRGLVSGKGSQSADASQIAASVEVPTIKVLVAARDLKPGERLAEADLTWMEWPEASLNPAYVTDGDVKTPLPPEDAVKVEAKVKGAAEKAGDVAEAVLAPASGMEDYLGGMVREEILKNEPLIDRKIVRAEEGGFMAVMLDAGKRAMAVPISAENAAAGFILPGDRVDIMVSREVPRVGGAGGSMQVVEPVLRNIKVLAIDQALQAAKDQQSVVGATATLELSAEDGQALALARSQGSLSLMLRSYADASGPTGRVGPIDQGMPSNTVRVFRNGQASEVSVAR